jgi:hypothetical protein
LKTPPKRRAGTAPAQAAFRKLKPRHRNVAAARLALRRWKPIPLPRRALAPALVPVPFGFTANTR